MDFLAEVFTDAAERFSAHGFMYKAIQVGYTKLLEYWNRTERAPAYIAAIVLNPTQKWSYFDDWEESWQPNMKPALKQFWESSYRSSTGLPKRSNTPLPTANTDNQFYQWMNRRRGGQDAMDELDRYINEPLMPFSDDTAHDWWVRPEQRVRLPLLSKMAIDIFSIPAMSSEPERVFSGAKHTISEQRNSLKADTIEILECLKSWFRLGIFTEQDLHAVVASQGSTEIELEAEDSDAGPH